MSADGSRARAQMGTGWRYAIFGLAIAAGVVRNGYRRYQEDGGLDASWFAVAAAISVIAGLIVFLVSRLTRRSSDTANGR